jgi:hypothetical protein
MAMASQWFYLQDGIETGPVPSSELKLLAAAGKLKPTDLIWKEGMRGWVPASRLTELFPPPPLPTLPPTPPPPRMQPPPLPANEPPTLGGTQVEELMWRALESIRSGRFEEAITACTAILQIQRDSKRALTFRGSAYHYTDRNTLALPDLSAAIRLCRTDDELLPTLLHVRGLTCLKLAEMAPDGNFRELALQDFKEANRLDPTKEIPNCQPKEEGRRVINREISNEGIYEEVEDGGVTFSTFTPILDRVYRVHGWTGRGGINTIDIQAESEAAAMMAFLMQYPGGRVAEVQRIR